ncbi:hypothetical protein [Streptomyces sp. NBC_01264]|uniref:hypothetical protein n=1 Tax=Streptomyces sp. NBC_01264 TaxID=2903804 RepID=UPI00224F5B31|nr:hypothetical protein [Streptomyces sp. NBC_01264]MCX4784641.1 hypothetical protein [Streptomyces sp. NBC_01264]
MDKRHAAAIEADNAREDAGMHSDDRVTCYTHQAWAEDCEDRHQPLTALRVLAAGLEADRSRAQH